MTRQSIVYIRSLFYSKIQLKPQNGAEMNKQRQADKYVQRSSAVDGISPSSNSPSWGSVVGGGTSQWSGESIESPLNGLRTEFQGFREAKKRTGQRLRDSRCTR